MQISGNHTLNGEGVAALGDCCPHLLELNISRCTEIATWALANVCKGCTGLESLNLSQCPQINDEIIRSFAEK